MTINNVSIQYNGGLLPDIILLTQCYPILCLMGCYIASGFAFTTMFDGVLCSVLTGFLVSLRDDECKYIVKRGASP